MTVQEKLIAIYEQAEKRLKEIILQKGAYSSAAMYQRTLLRQIEDELRRLRRRSAAAAKQLVDENYRKGLEDLVGELKAEGISVENLPSDNEKPTDSSSAAGAAAKLMMSGLNRRQIETVAGNAVADLDRAVSLVGKRVKDFIRDEIGADTTDRSFKVPNLIGRREQDVIRADTLDATAEKLSTGQTIRQMQKNLEEKLSERDITAVPYKNGAEMPLKKYAEMTARSTTAEAQNTAKTTQGAEWGFEFVRMTSHSPTCAVCAQYQGRVYALTKEASEGKYKLKDGTVLRFPYLYDTAFASGYQTIHPNCRHRIAVIPLEAYTNEQLKKFSEDSTKPFEDTRSDQERKAYSADQARKRKQNEMRKQYEKIKQALPDTAPKSFAGFVRMKATNSQKYQELMQDYRYIQRESKARYKDSEGLFLTIDARDPSKGRDVIKPHNIINDLMKSDVGKKSLSFIKENNIPVYLSYNSDEGNETLLGYFDHGIITIFADRTKTVKETACIIVHEVTHARINKPNSKTQELQCYKNEYIHRGIELTDEVIQSIIKHIDKKYDVLEWE